MEWAFILASTAIACFTAGASVIWIPTLTVMGIALDRRNTATT